MRTVIAISKVYIKFIGIDPATEEIVYTRVRDYETMNEDEIRLDVICDELSLKVTILVYISNAGEFNRGLQGQDLRTCHETRRLYIFESHNTRALLNYEQKMKKLDKQLSPYVRISKNIFVDSPFKDMYRYIWEEKSPIVS